MEVYRYKDVIIDPHLALKDIGKTVYYGGSPSECLRNANEDRNFKTLVKVFPFNDYPFSLEGYTSCPCIIVKKEESTKYVPFDSIEEFVEASLKHNGSHFLSKTGSIWLKQKTIINAVNKDTIFMVNGVNIGNNTISLESGWVSSEVLLEKYAFLDGTPCGKLI